MRVRTKITLCVTSLATVVFACAALLIWNSDRSSYNHKRSILAFKELAHYLQLSGEVYQTFGKVHRDLIDGKGELMLNLDDAELRINEIVDNIERAAVAETEIGARTLENRNDPERARLLRQELKKAFTDIRMAQQLASADRKAEAADFLRNSLESRGYSRINSLIDEALEGERTELADALNEIELIDDFAMWAAIAAVIAGMILTMMMIFVLVLRLRNSLINLEAGAEIFAAGNLNHQIPIHGYDEFSALSQRLNVMARQLRKQRVELEDARSTLECRVAERTGELMTANAELERRDAMRRQFFADIGHELRTPITAVRGEAEVSLRTRRNQREAYRSALNRIVNITDQLTRFVNDVFLIAREQAGVADMRCDKIDLGDVVISAVTQMRSLIDQHEVTVSTELTDGPTRMEGDTQRLCQLIHILLSNAIQHSPAGIAVSVDITIRRDGEFWELNVTDNGPGIPAGEIAQVFDRFYRGGSRENSDRLQGTGLGLPIARSIVQAHGGKIWIDPDYKPGTSILAAFPILDDIPKDVMISQVSSVSTKAV